MFDLYLEYEYWFAAAQLVTAMMGMGATLSVNDFLKVVSTPKAVSIGLLLQLCAVPLLAYAFIVSIGLGGAIAISIAMIAAIPGGTTSNVFTYLARGNAPLSITITGVSTIACLFTAPIILQLLTANATPENFRMPVAQIAFEIGVCLLVPLLIGMVAKQFLPSLAAGLAKWGVRTSLFIILLIVIGASGSGRLDMDAFGTYNATIICCFALLLVVLGLSVPRLLKLANNDATAIEMEVVVRNTNLGILINASLFPAATSAGVGMGGIVLFSLLLYGGLQMLAAVPLILFNKRLNLAK